MEGPDQAVSHIYIYVYIYIYGWTARHRIAQGFQLTSRVERTSGGRRSFPKAREIAHISPKP